MYIEMVFISMCFEPPAPVIFSDKVGSHTCGSMYAIESSIVLEPINHQLTSTVVLLFCECFVRLRLTAYFLGLPFLLVSQVTGLAFQSAL